jgi:hypothetical protein
MPYLSSMARRGFSLAALAAMALAGPLAPAQARVTVTAAKTAVKVGSSCALTASPSPEGTRWKWTVTPAHGGTLKFQHQDEIVFIPAPAAGNTQVTIHVTDERNHHLTGRATLKILP